jgi:hypothetical protein
MARVTRLLALCGWIAWALRRVLGDRPRFLGSSRLRAGVVIGVLIGLTGVPFALSFQGDQPEQATVGDVVAGAIERADRWIRVRGEVRPIEASELQIPDLDRYALLFDAEDPTLAIAVRGDDPPRGQVTVTGRLAPFAVALPGFSPADQPATSEPRLVPNLILELDREPYPERQVVWGWSLLPLGIAGLLGIGLRLGYPIVRRGRETNVLARPLAPGERLPVALAGRVGERRIPLHDPAEAVLLVSPGRRGGVLTIQLLGDQPGRHAAPVSVGEGWATGQVAWVHTVRESVPALVVETEAADAVLMFASPVERDRAAALVGAGR